jgi:hypothetical protein
MNTVVKPKDYLLKKWLVDNVIEGLRVERVRPAGISAAYTVWHLKAKGAEAERSFAPSEVQNYVRIAPAWNRVLEATGEVMGQIQKYEEYLQGNSEDMAEYLRLKAKLGL